MRVTLSLALAASLLARAAEEDSSELVLTEALLASSSEAPKKGGGSSSIGTDAYDIRTQTAWFYGSKPVVTCFNHVESFGPSERDSRKALERAIQRWRDYFQEKKIVKAAGELSPNVNLKLKGKCKGNEDLVIFFGTGPIFAGLQDLKAVQRLGFPAAYVNKTHMSRDMKWSKGYIRLVAQDYYRSEAGHFPDWKKPNALEAILTHELGHVLGFAHAPHTIMQAELTDQVLAGEPVRLTIDGSKQLVSCAECVNTLNFAGKNSSGLEKLGLRAAKTKLVKSGRSFKLTDGKNQLELQETSRASSGPEKTLLSNFDEPINDTRESFHLYAYVQVKAQKTPLVLEYNSGAAHAVLRTVEDGEIREIGRFERE